MKMFIDVNPNLPPQVNRSYGSFGFYKLGVCCWLYDDNYCGEVEWINTLKFVTAPKLDNPVAFRYWFQQGVIATITPKIQVNLTVPDMQINGIEMNAVTGKNMPPPFLIEP